MTTPAPEEQDGNMATILTALVTLMITGAAVAAFIALMLRLAGMHLEALRYLFRPREPLADIWLIERPPPATGEWSEPQFQQYNQNLHRRASYLVNASRRMSRAYESGGVQGLRDAYERERQFWQQHQRAAQRRADSARLVGEAMERISAVRLGWYAVLDERTSPECRQAHGRNFDPNRIPPIGYPGSVHPSCRCRPGIPFATRGRVESIRPDYARSA